MWHTATRLILPVRGLSSKVFSNTKKYWCQFFFWGSLKVIIIPAKLTKTRAGEKKYNENSVKDLTHSKYVYYFLHWKCPHYISYLVIYLYTYLCEIGQWVVSIVFLDLVLGWFQTVRQSKLNLKSCQKCSNFSHWYFFLYKSNETQYFLITSVVGE